MRNNVKKVLSIVLSMIMLISCFTFSQISVGAADLTIIAEGWFETVYAEWTPVTGAGFYEAYVKKSSDSEYEILDDDLIRQYDTYMRADAVGLPAGSYDMKIVAYDSEGGSEIASAEQTNITVYAYDRSGFAFSSNSTYYSEGGIGAYNNDGSLKENAKVFYVTAENAKTITTNVITSSNGATTTYAGLQDIIYGYQKGYDTTPISFRIIGTITKDDLDRIDSSEEGLQIKGKNSYSLIPITIEGIGNDAAVSGFGFLLRNAGNVEFRNFAILNCMDDGVSMDSYNANVWVHNMDFFYGQAGSDSDQAKGDGTVDIKNDSQYITVSYNHFWDSGKSSLCGMKSETQDNYITYHHNWFDHSDSRHPRIRYMTVHIYNNYYDGNSKYGVGVTTGSSAFAEGNYFRNVSKPVMSSMQGTDATGDGTFSGEDGGIIKMYNNIMTGSYRFIEANSSSRLVQDSDAYTVENRSDTVPSTLTTVQGGTTYNNFDTSDIDLGVDESDIHTPDQVPATVMNYAGRCNGGDIFYEMDDSTEDSNYSVISALKTIVTSYTSSLRVVGGTVDSSALDTSAAASSATGVDGNTSYTDREASQTEEAAALGLTSDVPSCEADETTTEEETEETTEETTEEETETTTAPTEGTLVYNLTSDENTLGVSFTGNMWSSAEDNPITYNGETLTVAAKMESRTSITFTTGSDGTLTLVFYSTNSDPTVKVDGETYSLTADSSLGSGVYVLEIALEAGSHEITKGTTSTYLYYASAALTTSETTTEETTEETSEETSEETTEEISEETTENTEPTTAAPTGEVEGDVDGDGVLTANDSASLLHWVLTGEAADGWNIYDIDGSGGNPDANDAAKILRKVLNAAYNFTE